MTHQVVRVCLVDGSSLGHTVVPRGFNLGATAWTLFVPGLLPTGLPGELLPTTFRVEAETRCKVTPADFNPGDRIEFEFAESQTNHCRVYWGDGHRCLLERGHPADVQHSCGVGCPEYLDPIAYGPDIIPRFER